MNNGNKLFMIDVYLYLENVKEAGINRTKSKTGITTTTINLVVGSTDIKLFDGWY